MGKLRGWPSRWLVFERVSERGEKCENLVRHDAIEGRLRVYLLTHREGRRTTWSSQSRDALASSGICSSEANAWGEGAKFGIFFVCNGVDIYQWTDSFDQPSS